MDLEATKFQIQAFSTKHHHSTLNKNELKKTIVPLTSFSTS